MIDKNLLEGNKYFKWYWSICNRAKDRILSPDIYVEKHHIYPKSIYGQNKDLIKLTAKEHYIVHLLLWYGLREKYGTYNKITRSMASAFVLMNNFDKNKKRFNIKNSKEYSFFRIAASESKKGINNPMYGKTFKHSHETKEKMKLNHADVNGINNPMYGKIGAFTGRNHTMDHIIKMRNTNTKKVYQYDKDFNFIKEWNSAASISRELGFERTSILACCKGKYKSSAGFIWRYEKI